MISDVCIYQAELHFKAISPNQHVIIISTFLPAILDQMAELRVSQPWHY